MLDASGKLMDSISATKRRGLNRVSWSMRVKPPRVPRAAQVAFGASRGPRVPPGTYTVRLTRGSEVLETKLSIGLDRRATYGIAERKEQFDAVMRVHALFGEMSKLVDRIETARNEADGRTKNLPESDELGRRIRLVAGRIADLKRKIVATKEGGAITGEERIREHTDTLYSALNGWEGRPARYQLERIDVLGRELSEVAQEFDSLVDHDIRPLDTEFKNRKPEGIVPPPT